MLNAPVDNLIYDELNEKCTGVSFANGHSFKCKYGVVGDPSYFPGLVINRGRVIRAICILKGPIPNTSGVDSVQIILPQRQLLRRYGTQTLCVHVCIYTCAYICSFVCIDALMCKGAWDIFCGY